MIKKDKFKDYKDIIKEIKKSNCIVEILQKNQTGSTLRYYEAICYNKKLLTNNINVMNLPFYNEKYIRIFDDSFKIDYDWIKEEEIIDYQYNNLYSPIKILDLIEKDL